MRGVLYVLVRSDDILVIGESDEVYFSNVDEVLGRLEVVGLRVKRVKCRFFVLEVVYMGYVVDEYGYRSSEEKAVVVLNALSSVSVVELRSFLGMFNYYGRFFRGFAIVLEFFYVFLRKGSRWEWILVYEEVFVSVKRLLGLVYVFVYYDINLLSVVSCDALFYGIGVVLF